MEWQRVREDTFGWCAKVNRVCLFAESHVNYLLCIVCEENEWLAVVSVTILDTPVPNVLSNEFILCVNDRANLRHTHTHVVFIALAELPCE